MPSLSGSDLTLLGIVVTLGGLYLFKDVLSSKPKAGLLNGNSLAASKLNGSAAGGASADLMGGRNFVDIMKNAKKRICIVYGSQTGTAEDYATRFAKEAKARFGVSSLVIDPEDYDFDCLDTLSEDCLMVFFMATYGEGEPTDNSVGLMEFFKDDGITFSNGGNRLEGMKYTIFALGNTTYEHFCAIGRILDERLTALGATRIGERGEGDDDKSMEEDYLAWKDPVMDEISHALNLTSGSIEDIPDFTVSSSSAPPEKVFLGELSQRALVGSRGVYDAKNPYPAEVVRCEELFGGKERNCVGIELGIDGTGMRYQAGDHVGVWPMNPDVEVQRLLKVLGMADKASESISVTSLDPTLAKVPFPVPSTYDSILRFYLDICSPASRQQIGSFAKWAPTEEARTLLEGLGKDKDQFAEKIGNKGLKISEALIWSTGGDYLKDPFGETNWTNWEIPFDRIISTISRLQPRFYSISSSPKMYPNSIHLTAVVLKYQPGQDSRKPFVKGEKFVFGVGTNYLLNVKNKVLNLPEDEGLTQAEGGDVAPRYKIEGPRGKYFDQEKGKWKVPIHVRRSNFRLPTSPKVPVVMIGPGTGVAPFRGFVQERVALARRTKEKDPENGLKDWAPIILFYGCRRSTEDFLYKDEWEEYAKELDGKFKFYVAFSREPDQPKTYVQQLIDQKGDEVVEALVDKKGYCYICGDAKNMAKEVERKLEDLMSKGGDRKVGEKELKTLKDRNRLLLDVWS